MRFVYDSFASELEQVSADESLSDGFEARMRQQLAPILDFLQQAEKIQNGYPHRHPDRAESCSQYFQGPSSALDHFGFTLKHNVTYHGSASKRYIEVTAYPNDSCDFNLPAQSISLKLFEDNHSELELPKDIAKVLPNFSERRKPRPWQKEEGSIAFCAATAWYFKIVAEHGEKKERGDFRLSSKELDVAERFEKLLIIARDNYVKHFGEQQKKPLQQRVA